MLKIREARESRGWTQEQLANALDTTQQTIQRWETGFTDPKSSGILAISETLGVTVSYLMGMDEPVLPEFPLTPDEYLLITLFNKMDKTGRSALLDNAAFLAERHPLNTGSSVRSA